MLIKNPAYLPGNLADTLLEDGEVLRGMVNQPTKVCNFIKKETLAQVFSCEFCKIFKNTFFTEHLWKTAYDL